ARGLRQLVVGSPVRWSSALGAVLIVILLIAFSGSIVAFIVRRRLSAHPERAPAAAAALWYQRMTRAVAKRGWQKNPAQTPAEFVESISDMDLRGAVANFTDHY